MGIVVQRAEGSTVRRGSDEGYVPLVRCDACGRPVGERSGGRVAWDPDQNVTCLDAAFLHEGCVEQYRKQQAVDLRVDELGAALEELAPFAGSTTEV